MGKGTDIVSTLSHIIELTMVVVVNCTGFAGLPNYACCVVVRKLPSKVVPSGVRIDSGWN